MLMRCTFGFENLNITAFILKIGEQQYLLCSIYCVDVVVHRHGCLNTQSLCCATVVLQVTEQTQRKDFIVFVRPDERPTNQRLEWSHALTAHRSFFFFLACRLYNARNIMYWQVCRNINLNMGGVKSLKCFPTIFFLFVFLSFSHIVESRTKAYQEMYIVCQKYVLFLLTDLRKLNCCDILHVLFSYSIT